MYRTTKRLICIYSISSKAGLQGKDLAKLTRVDLASKDSVNEHGWGFWLTDDSGYKIDVDGEFLRRLEHLV